jgi:hypothetical protein
MCQVALPVPPKEIQESIIAMHEVLQTRISISIKVQKMISSSAPVLFSGIIRDIEKEAA